MIAGLPIAICDDQQHGREVADVRGLSEYSGVLRMCWKEERLSPLPTWRWLAPKRDSLTGSRPSGRRESPISALLFSMSVTTPEYVPKHFWKAFVRSLKRHDHVR